MMLSACLVIHNEEAVLDRCLKSMKDIVDEIILVHDGTCHDKSLSIASEHKAKIFVRPFVGEAEYHRPFAFRKAKGSWILHLDADEILSGNLKKNIPILINSKTCQAYSFSWPYPNKKKFIKTGPFSRTVKPVLFRKKHLYMLGLSHEYPRTYGKLCQRLDLFIHHQPQYDNFTIKAFKDKWKKWANIQARQIINLDKLPVFNIPVRHVDQIYQYQIKIFRWPILTGLYESLKFILIYLSRGLLLSGIRSWKIACMELMYLWLVRYYLIRNKK